jgi:hypothetical protein
MNSIQEFFGKKKFGAIAGYGILIVITLFIIKYDFGVSSPGSFFERNSYSTKVYVLASPENNGTKSYSIPADITKDENGYSVNKIYWPNAGYSTFDSCIVYLNKKVNCTVTNSKAFNKLVDKTTQNPDALGNNVNDLLSLPSYYIQLTSHPIK